jgi:hypothetical protein
MPWLLGIAQDIDIAVWDADDADDQKQFRQELMRWALGHFLQFVPIPKWLGEHSLPPADWDACDRRLMRFMPPPAGLLRMN